MSVLPVAIALAGSLALAGCAPPERQRLTVANSWVGTPIEVFTARYGNPVRTFQNPDGKTVYQYNFTALDPTCMYYWVVNKDDVIGDFYSQGWCHSL